MAENMMSEPIYTGTKQPQPGERDDNGLLRLPYLPDDGLVEAVNLAILLERPLLIQGEPGCGKTRLAQAVAYELGWPCKEWYVKSTSRSRDGLYVFDSIGRLRDAQLAAQGLQQEREKSRKPENYVTLGPLGTAFAAEQCTVVLIDEIDKADVDFPNDLLLELDEQRFTIEETGRPIIAKARPLIVITSNDEKELPDAFLRRCLFYYIQFPSAPRLKAILDAHFPQESPQLVEVALQRFFELRKEMEKDKGQDDVRKKVSTSELIDWFRVLRRYPQDEVLAKLNGQLPYASVLLKSWDDHRRYVGSS
jgi:MoxR-like ATPase